MSHVPRCDQRLGPRLSTARIGARGAGMQKMRGKALFIWTPCFVSAGRATTARFPLLHLGLALGRGDHRSVAVMVSRNKPCFRSYGMRAPTRRRSGPEKHGRHFIGRQGRSRVSSLIRP
jgi:hypothetical protein